MNAPTEMHSEAERHAYWLMQRLKARRQWSASACRWCGMAPTPVLDWWGKHYLTGCGS